MVSGVVAKAYGGAEVLAFEAIELPEPAAHEARVRQSAVGVNYIDVYIREGLYPHLTPPGVIGMEGAGVVETVGREVRRVKPGDRVAYVTPTIGAYAEARNVDETKLVVLPDGVSEQDAAALMLKGMTAEYLLHRTHDVQPGETILVTAAAGGVGLLLCAWAAHRGATVIGLVGSKDKAELARAHGCQHPVLYRETDIEQAVMDITGGKGVAVAYDAVGKDTFDKSLASLASRGHLVSFGQASGPVAPLNIAVLSPKALSLSRPTLFAYTATAAELDAIAGNMFRALRDGVIKPGINQTFPLAEAAAAHRALEARQTTGATVLLP